MYSLRGWTHIQTIVSHWQVLHKLKFVTDEVVWQYCPQKNIQLKQDYTLFYSPQGGAFVGQGPGRLKGQLGMGAVFAMQDQQQQQHETTLG